MDILITLMIPASIMLLALAVKKESLFSSLMLPLCIIILAITAFMPGNIYGGKAKGALLGIVTAIILLIVAYGLYIGFFTIKYRYRHNVSWRQAFTKANKRFDTFNRKK